MPVLGRQFENNCEMFYQKFGFYHNSCRERRDGSWSGTTGLTEVFPSTCRNDATCRANYRQSEKYLVILVFNDDKSFIVEKKPENSCTLVIAPPALLCNLL